ncbi:unnamed protein product [Haemonchus placei]|uniref:Secreted protein n=1 Tax=Haemonchus placei TaxID=6290 RepID=A0A0N4WXM9_HAEPC|nr:unnamed protein product [Haemonchus placei]
MMLVRGRTIILCIVVTELCLEYSSTFIFAVDLRRFEQRTTNGTSGYGARFRRSDSSVIVRHLGDGQLDRSK